MSPRDRIFQEQLARENANVVTVYSERMDELESALRSLVIALDHMGRERELLDEVHYARLRARAILGPREQRCSRCTSPERSERWFPPQGIRTGPEQECGHEWHDIAPLPTSSSPPTPTEAE